MSEKPDSDDFDEDADATGAGAEEVDYEFLIDDLGKPKKGAPPPGEPAWRKLEKYREQRETAELISDFDDYEIGDDGIKPSRKSLKRRQP